MTTFEAILVWLTIVAYALSAVAFIAGAVFGKERWIVGATWCAAGGLLAHGLMLGLRWIRLGHGPVIGYFEIGSGLAFLSVGGFLALSRRYRGMNVTGAALMPVAFFIMGSTLLVDPMAPPYPASFSSIWLAIHVLFANLAYGAYVASFILAVAYLMREAGHSGRWTTVLERLPLQAEIDGLTFRLVGAGFLFQGIMIASGAVWANESWGRYWGWDPMETWSLVAWVVYAVYLHLRLTLGWSGKRAAWVLVVALPVIVFSLLGVPVVYKSIHGAYLTT